MAPRTVPEIFKVARQRYRHPINRNTWPWRFTEIPPPGVVELDVTVPIEPDVLYHFEVLRLRLGQERPEAVREAIGMAIVKMTLRADRLRKFELRELIRTSEDDPLLDDYLDRGLQRLGQPPSAPQAGSEGQEHAPG